MSHDYEVQAKQNERRAIEAELKYNLQALNLVIQEAKQKGYTDLLMKYGLMQRDSDG